MSHRFDIALAKEIQPNTEFVIRHGDELRISSFCSITGVTLTVTGRIITPIGETKRLQRGHAPNTDRSVNTTRIDLTNGFLQNVAVAVSAGTPERGECYVICELWREAGGTDERIAVLFAAYITTNRQLSWPIGLIEAPTDGQGAIKVISVANPGAGVQFSQAVPTNALWRPLIVRYLLTPSAVAGTRRAGVEYNDGTNVLGRFMSGGTQAASTAQQHTFGHGTAISVVAGSEWNNGLPHSVRLKAAMQINSFTPAFDVGDAFTAIFITVEEWLDI